MPTVGVIGAGISGLTAAYRLDREGISVKVLEATDRGGGVIRSERTEGYLVEHGPNSIRASSPELESLIADLGLDEDRVWADAAAATRYVVRDGRPTALPTSIGSFLTTDLFSSRAKLRLLAEPFMHRRTDGNESVAAFTRRRLGQEVLDYAVSPFVGGVFAGDPEQLSIRHAFDRLADLERDHGSLFLGFLASAFSKSKDDVPSGLFSFRQGLETLPEALASALDDQLRLNAPVTSFRKQKTTWEVRINPPDETPQTFTFDALISTVPLHSLAQIELDTSVDCTPLQKVPYPPVSVLALGYPRDAIEHPLDGFGLLVPPVETDIDILGTLFSSTLFPNRAPGDQVLLTTFVGGARAPSLARTSTEALRGVVERDLDRLLNVNGPPTFVRHVYWPRAIPQYVLGYESVLATLEELETQHSTLAFAGNYRQGISVGDALTSGAQAADRILRVLSSRETTAA